MTDPNKYRRQLRKKQKKEAWIANIIRILGKSREEATALYYKIKPK